MPQPGHWIEMERWPRRATFAFYRAFESPFFNLCTAVDVAATVQACRENGHRFSLVAWYACMKAANQIPAFRQRVRGEEVWEHKNIFVGSTVLRDDDSFGFCYFPYAEDLAGFMAGAELALSAFHAGDGAGVLTDRDDLIHGSVIPWTHFVSMTHARRVPAVDSVPKIVFGRYLHDGGKAPMPISVEVHHAVADGLHVGQFLQALEALFAAPGEWM